MALDPTASKAPDRFVKIGRLGRTFQLDGALRVLLDEAVSYAYEDGTAAVGERALEAAGQLFVTRLGNARLRQLYVSGGSLLIKLEGVRDRNAAQTLVNATLWIDPERLPEELAEELTGELEAGSNEERLVGRPVLLNGRPVGEVSAAQLDGPNPVVEVTLTASAASTESATPGARVLGGAHEGGADSESATAGARPSRSLVPLQAPYVALTEAGVELTDPPEGLLDLP